MIEPQVEHGGASSWFWIAANFEAVGLGDGAPADLSVVAAFCAAAAEAPAVA